METSVLIYGGGASGVCAAIQAARMGADVVVVEPTEWVGGMITAAGVSALDGNKHGLGGGIVHEFREALADHYGSIDALYTGWVSLYCYEPRVGQEILRRMCDVLPSLTLRLESDVVRYRREGERRRAVDVIGRDGTTETIRCDIFVDCSEYGDGIAMAELPYRLGREGRDELEESAAPIEPDDELQDITYVATLRRDETNEPGPPATLVEETYWRMFECSTSEDCASPDPESLHHAVHDWQSFLSYGMLPNDRFMLNWPFRSNDYPVTPSFFESPFVRRHTIASARLHTEQYVRYMQHRLGHPEWRLDEGAYPTGTGLALIPYVRESRRIVNSAIMVQDDVVAPPGCQRAPWRSDVIAVGDYFLDHHHGRSFECVGRLVEDYPENAPFSIPISVLFPEGDDASFMAGEKSIAVSHIVNGCTRLQPVVMLLGQAIGCIAALATKSGCAPADVPVNDVQRALIRAGAQLYPVYDVGPDHHLFEAVQSLALRRVLREDDALWLKTDAVIDAEHARKLAARAGLADAVDGAISGPFGSGSLHSSFAAHLEARSELVTRGDFLGVLHALTHRAAALPQGSGTPT